MSKRLHVRFDEKEFSEIRSVARRHGLTTAEWVRRALRAARYGEPRGDTGPKLAVVRAAARHAFPTAGIDQLLEEIEQCYSPPET